MTDLYITLPQNFGVLVEEYKRSLLKGASMTAKTGEPEISYDSTAGDGAVNGVPFKLKDGSPEYVLFRQLYSRMGKKIQRNEILVLIGFYRDDEEPNSVRRNAETEAINEATKNIRRSAKLSNRDLVLNNGNLTLKARKTRP